MTGGKMKLFLSNQPPPPPPPALSPVYCFTAISVDHFCPLVEKQGSKQGLYIYIYIYTVLYIIIGVYTYNTI